MHQEQQVSQIHFCDQKQAICLDQQCDNLSDCCQECILTVHQNHNCKNYQEISQFLHNVDQICSKYEERILSLQYQIGSLIKSCQSWVSNQKLKTLQLKRAIEEQQYDVIHGDQNWLLFWLSNIDNNNQIIEIKSNIFGLLNDIEETFKKIEQEYHRKINKETQGLQIQFQESQQRKNLQQAQIKERKAKEALQLFRQSSISKEKALFYIEKAIEMNQNSDEAYFEKAKILYLDSENQSLQYFNKAFNLNPKNQRSYQFLIQILINLSRDHECLLTVEKAIESNPPNIEFYIKKSQILRRLKLFQYGEEYMREQIKGVYRSPMVICNLRVELGVNLFYQGKYEEALSSLKYTYFPLQSPISKMFIGCCLLKLHRGEEALKCFLQSENKSEQEDFEIFIKNAIGLSYLELRQFQNAITIFDEIIRNNDKFYPAFINKGISLFYLNNKDDAILQFDGVSKLESKTCYGFINKGILLQESNQNDSALEVFEQALTLNQNCTLAQRQKAQLLMKKQQLSEALLCFQKINASDRLNLFQEQKDLKFVNLYTSVPLEFIGQQ